MSSVIVVDISVLRVPLSYSYTAGGVFIVLQYFDVIYFNVRLIFNIFAFIENCCSPNNVGAVSHVFLYTAA